MSILYDILVSVEKIFSANPYQGGVAELVDAADLKSVVHYGRAGSSPAAGTILQFYCIPLI